MGVTEPVPTLGARGGCQGWCGGRCWHSLSPPAFVLGPKPMTEEGGCEGVCACVCVYSHRALGVWWKGDLTSEPPVMSDVLTPLGTWFPPRKPQSGRGGGRL